MIYQRWKKLTFSYRNQMRIGLLLTISNAINKVSNVFSDLEKHVTQTSLNYQQLCQVKIRYGCQLYCPTCHCQMNQRVQKDFVPFRVYKDYIYLLISVLNNMQKFESFLCTDSSFSSNKICLKNIPKNKLEIKKYRISSS